ncbi:MAG: hypothetical protein ABTQ32_16335 [Myxococcaceae bacterium]
MSALSFEQAPPASVPLRFFVTAPFFGVAAGLVLAWNWEAVTASRWAPESVAVVHLVTVGFMLQVMAGALLQVLPVAVGANVSHPKLVAAVVHPCLTLGGALLPIGFLGAGRLALQAAAVLLAVGVFGFVIAAGLALVRSPAMGPTLLVLRLAVVGLAIAASLGLGVTSVFGFSRSFPLGVLLDLHVAWASLGWALMLLMGVAYLVVPMFQLTPPYPVRTGRVLPALLVTALLGWTVAMLAGVDALGWLSTAVGLAGACGFAIVTLRLQAKRRRKVTDSTLWAWRVAMACLLLAAGSEAVLRLLPAEEPLRARLEYLTGAALFAGAFPSAIAGMLSKIVGFLGWLHLQKVSMPAPTMQQVMPEVRARWHLRVSLVALAFILLAAVWPVLAVPGGVLFAVASAGLGWSVGLGLLHWRRHLVASRPT